MAKKIELSAEQQQENAALALVYIDEARTIARQRTALEKAMEKAEAAKGGTWGGFKDAARKGFGLKHDTATMGKGITLACAELGVPQGTLNAYLPILRKLYGEGIGKPEAEQAELLALSVKEARERWQPGKPKAHKSEPETDKAKDADGAQEAGDGSAGDADGMMGGTERSRILSRINAALSALSDDDLSEVLGMLESEYGQAKAA